VNTADLLELLSRISLPRVFNPYSSVCPIFDRPEAAAIRTRNLASFLGASVQSGCESPWVGRDLGYLGGRRTGIPLTDELHLSKLAEVFQEFHFEKATEGEVAVERTAKMIWVMVARLPKTPFLWNVFPLHPHEAGNPFSNRAHSAQERKLGEEILEQLLLIIQPARVVALGNDAFDVLHRMDPRTAKVRHPSYGGHLEFRHGIESLYAIR
jgi:uracil-DNA glycosylase